MDESNVENVKMEEDFADFDIKCENSDTSERNAAVEQVNKIVANDREYEILFCYNLLSPSPSESIRIDLPFVLRFVRRLKTLIYSNFLPKKRRNISLQSVLTYCQLFPSV